MWKRCSSCRDPIDFEQAYWKCSVSTCQRSRTALYFCQVSCWDAHLATANHREAWAVEANAPSKRQWEAEQAESETTTKSSPPTSTPAPVRRVASSSSAPRQVIAPAASTSAPKDILIVVSKLKKYLREAHGMKTSDAVASVLSDYVRKLCDRAVLNSHDAERKTVLDRDFNGLF